MKKIHRIFLALWIILFTTACGPAGSLLKTVDEGGTEDLLEFYRDNLLEEYYTDLEKLSGATRYEIDVNIDVETATVDGNQRLLYTNCESMPLDEIVFRMFPNVSGDFLSVQNIKVDGKAVESKIAYMNTALIIELVEDLAPGDSAVLTMDFSQQVPDYMGGNYGLYVYIDDILALDNFFPIIPVYNEEGWNVEDPPRNADMVFTDAAFFDVRVSAPQNWVLVTSGVEVETEKEGSRKTVRFAGGPQRDFYVVASPRFVRETELVGGTLVRSFFPPEFAERGALVLNVAADALEIFSERYGEYPYTEFDLVSTPMQAGGMEYAGLGAMSLFLYEAGVTYSGVPNNVFLELATAHEVAHQWFFNMVMNDQLDEPWLDEGFAQYLTYIYYLDTYGVDAAEAYRKGDWEQRWGRLDRAPIPIGKPAGDYELEQYGPIIYARAPIFITELEEEMGNDVFMQFLMEYVETYRWKIVDTEDLKSMAEEACGCVLTPMFDEWWRVN